MIKWVWEG